MRGMKLCATTQQQVLELEVFGLFILLCHLIGWKRKYTSSAPLYPADDRWNLSSDCFLSAPAPPLFSCILRCARTVCTVRAVREEHGVAGCSVPLSNPQSKWQKAAFFPQIPVITRPALHWKVCKPIIGEPCIPALFIHLRPPLKLTNVFACHSVGAHVFSWGWLWTQSFFLLSRLIYAMALPRTSGNGQ